jgi:hypothetical protein
VAIRSNIFLGVTPFRPADVHGCLGGMYCLHLQGKRIRQASNREEAGSKQSNVNTSIGLHGVTFQKIILFVHYSLHKIPPLVPILSQSTLFHATSVRFILILTSFLYIGFTSCFFPSDLFGQNVCIHSLTLTCTL